MKIPSMMIIVRVIFLVKKYIYILFTSFIGWMFVWNIFVKSKNEFKKVNVKNCAFYYFDDIMEIEDINVDNILLDENSLAYADAKLFGICFDKTDGVIKIYHGIRYLELSNSNDINYGIYNKVFDEINYLITGKSDDRYSINHILRESELIHITLYL